MRARVAVGLLALFVVGMVVRPVLDLERPTAIALFLSHLGHVSWDQLLYAGVPAALFAAGYERAQGSRRALVVALGSALAVALGVLFLERGKIASYAGSSGIGHALAAALALRGLGRRAGAAFFLVLLGKVCFELASGRLVCDVGLEAAGAVPVPSAHALGLASGSALALLLGDAREREPGPSPREIGSLVSISS